eukprot:scaffold71548_cov34-Phaeocystis_antarctica.AAC.1
MPCRAHAVHMPCTHPAFATGLPRARGGPAARPVGAQLARAAPVTLDGRRRTGVALSLSLSQSLSLSLSLSQVDLDGRRRAGVVRVR